MSTEHTSSQAPAANDAHPATTTCNPGKIPGLQEALAQKTPAPSPPNGTIPLRLRVSAFILKRPFSINIRGLATRGLATRGLATRGLARGPWCNGDKGLWCRGDKGPWCRGDIRGLATRGLATRGVAPGPRARGDHSPLPTWDSRGLLRPNPDLRALCTTHSQQP